jgi:YD repeat-containing protein
MLVSTTDPLGNSEIYSYDPAGHRTAFTDKNGNTTSYEYDCCRLISITDPLGNSESYGYDGNGNQTESMDKNGNITGYTYDALNRLIETEDAFGNTENNTYDAAGNLITFQDKRGNITGYTYDALNRLTVSEDALGNTESQTYDAVGNRITFQDKRGNETNYTYDALNRLVTTEDALGNTTTKTYDAAGNLITSQDKRGNITGYSYDALNRLVATEDALGNTTTKTYDSAGNLITHQDKNGNISTYTYDDLNRLVSTLDPLGYSTAYGYDENGNRITEEDENGNVTSYSYDALNRMITVTDPLANAKNYTYDPAGNTLTSTDADGILIQYEYDELNRLTKVTAPSGAEATYDYDASDNKTSATDPNGNTINYSYDPLNRLIKKSYPDGTHADFGYDAAGNLLLTDQTSGSGETITRGYDALNRVTSKETNYGDFSKTLTYDYDAEGNQTELTSGAGTVLYDYDALGRVEQTTDQQGRTTTFEYDNNGNQTAEIYPNGISTTRTFDAMNRVQQVITSPATKTQKQDRITFDCGITEIVSPVSGPGLTDHEEVTIIISNYGSEPAYDVAVGCSVNGSDFVIESLNQAVPAGYGPLSLNLSQTVDLSIPGEVYELMVCCFYELDENPENNCQNSIVIHETGGGLTHDCGISALISPLSGPGLTSEELVIVVVENYGDDVIMGALLSYSINGSDPVVEFLEEPLFPGEPFWYAFVETADLSIIGEIYELEICVMIDGDENPENDCLAAVVIHEEGSVILDCGISEITTPTSGSGLTESEPVTVIIHNFGEEPAFGLYLSYSINGGDEVSEFLEDPVYPGDPVPYTFSQTADLSVPGTYEILACAMMEGDENPDNNCHFTEVIHEEEEIYQSFYYEYDAAGNKVLEMHEDESAVSYTYDANNRLVEESYLPSGDLLSYAYTPAGRRASKTDNGHVSEYVYDIDGNLVFAGDTGFENDLNGNRLMKTEGDEITTYGYNFENQLIDATTPGGDQISYVLEAESFFDVFTPLPGEDWSRPISKTMNGKQMFYQSAGNLLLEEFDTTANILASYNPGISIDMGIETGFYHDNGRGDHTIQSGISQEEIAKTHFDTYGIPTIEGSWLNNSFGFHGASYDAPLEMYISENGLTYDQNTGSFCNSHLVFYKSNSYKGFSGDLDGWCQLMYSTPPDHICPPPCNLIYTGWKSWDCRFNVVNKGSSSGEDMIPILTSARINPNNNDISFGGLIPRTPHFPGSADKASPREQKTQKAKCRSKPRQQALDTYPRPDRPNLPPYRPLFPKGFKFPSFFSYQGKTADPIAFSVNTTPSVSCHTVLSEAIREYARTNPWGPWSEEYTRQLFNNSEWFCNRISEIYEAKCRWYRSRGFSISGNCPIWCRQSSQSNSFIDRFSQCMDQYGAHPRNMEDAFDRLEWCTDCIEEPSYYNPSCYLCAVYWGYTAGNVIGCLIVAGTMD